MRTIFTTWLRVRMALICILLTAASIFGLAVHFGILELPVTIIDVQLLPLSVSGLFVAITNAIALLLAANITINRFPDPHPVDIAAQPSGGISTTAGNLDLSVNDILTGEFEYARETAGQAMEERRTLINFYLIVIGGAGSGVVAFLPTISTQSGLLLSAVTLLWAVSVVGWLTLFQLIALRAAWMGSANAMNFIKEFYKKNVGIISPEAIDSAFFFKTKTLPQPAKHWNAGHYSAVVVSFLDAVAFGGGALLLTMALNGVITDSSVIFVSIMACFLFLGHFWVYDISLTYPRLPKK